MNVTSNYTEVESFRYLGIFIGILDIVVGTAGNLLTIVAVLKNKHLSKQPFNMFIVNLSAIDLLTASCMMPFNVTGYVLMQWPYGVEACILQAFFYFSCGYSSIVCLIAITINRLVGVVIPERYQTIFTPSTVRISLFFSWLIAPALLLPFLVVSLMRHSQNDPRGLITGWNEKQFLCTFVSLSGGWLTYMKVLRFVFQFLPTIIMTVCYSVMVYTLHKRNKKRDKSTNSYTQYKMRMIAKKTTEEARSAEPGRFLTVEDGHERVRRSSSILSRISQVVWRNEYKVEDGKIVRVRTSTKQRSLSHQTRHNSEVCLVYVSVLVCFVFTLLFLPSVVTNLLRRSFDTRIRMAASNITWLNSCVNPFVYVFLHRGMKKEYKRVLKQLFARFRVITCKGNDVNDS